LVIVFLAIVLLPVLLCTYFLNFLVPVFLKASFGCYQIHLNPYVVGWIGVEFSYVLVWYSLLVIVLLPEFQYCLTFSIFPTKNN